MFEEDPVVGIDFGTTFSCAAVIDNDQVNVIYGDDGFPSMASFVYFESTDDWIIGNSARDISFRNPSRGIYDMKRLIGKTIAEYEAVKGNKNYPYTIVTKNDRPYIQIKCQNTIQEFQPEEISAMILSKLKERAEQILKMKITKAVITVPIYFNDDQKEAVYFIGKKAGLQVLNIVDDVTATIIYFGLEKKYNDSNILVYDFGDTFKVSLVNINYGRIDIIASANNQQLCGDNINFKIAELMAREFKISHNIDIIQDIMENRHSDDQSAAKAFTRILKKAEIVKTQLSGTESVEIDLHNLYQDKDLEFTISRELFENICQDIFLQTLEHITQVLKEAQMNKCYVKEIVLVGGNSKIPFIRHMLKKYFEKEVTTSANPDQLIAIGAAKYATKGDEERHVNKEEIKSSTHFDQTATIEVDEQISNLNLLPSRSKKSVEFNVCPLSLGIHSNSGIMDVFISRNSKLPISVSKEYVYPNNAPLNMYVFAGERIMCVDNIFLCNLTLDGLTPTTEDHINIVFTLTVTEKYMLTVEATQKNFSVKNHAILDLKKHLSHVLFDELVEKAEVFKNEDEKKKKMAMLKLELRNYCHETMKKLENVKNISEKKRRGLLQACQKELQWLNSNKSCTIQDLEVKHKYLQDYWNIISRK